MFHKKKIVQVGAMTKEPLAGLMRLQFWRDTLEAIYKDNPRQQPVAMALHRVSHASVFF